MGHAVLLLAAGAAGAGAGLAASACRRPTPAEAGGRFEARWAGADTGRMAGRGTAEWCGSGRYLAVRGIRIATAAEGRTAESATAGRRTG